MSVPEATCQFFAPPLNSGGGGRPQFQFEDKESGTVSDTQYPLFKKPRISETEPHPRVFVAMETNKAMPSNFRTKLCSKFNLGKCNYGERCLFAHGLRNCDYTMSNEPKLCRMFHSGKKCIYEDRCRFLHEIDGTIRSDLGQLRESSVVRIVTTGSTGGQLECIGSLGAGFSANRVNSKTVTWKTRLCHKWEMTGDCSYGKICNFAHGQAELQKHGCYNTALESKTVQTTTSKILTTAKDVWTARTGTGTCYEQREQGVKRIFKSDELEKISRIYGDWIENTTFCISH